MKDFQSLFDGPRNNLIISIASHGLRRTEMDPKRHRDHLEKVPGEAIT